jgi:hypothetical protein
MDWVLLNQDLVTGGAVFWDVTSRSLMNRLIQDCIYLPNYLQPNAETSIFILTSVRISKLTFFMEDCKYNVRGG